MRGTRQCHIPYPPPERDTVVVRPRCLVYNEMVMKNYKKIFVVLSISFLIVPQIALAAWWNPLSWSVWNIFKPTPKAQQVQIATTTPTTTKKVEIAPEQENIKTNTTQKVDTQKIEIPKTSILTLPSGAVVEMDASGNIIRTIKEAPQQSYTPPAYTNPATPTIATTAQERQNQINSIISACNAEINQLKQEVIDLKNNYYNQVAVIQKQAIPIGNINGQINELTNDANQKIEQINLQIEQIQLDCENKINQL
jgi:hypothetical protein